MWEVGLPFRSVVKGLAVQIRASSHCGKVVVTKTWLYKCKIPKLVVSVVSKLNAEILSLSHLKIDKPIYTSVQKIGFYSEATSRMESTNEF